MARQTLVLCSAGVSPAGPRASRPRQPSSPQTAKVRRRPRFAPALWALTWKERRAAKVKHGPQRLAIAIRFSPGVFVRAPESREPRAESPSLKRSSSPIPRQRPCPPQTAQDLHIAFRAWVFPAGNCDQRLEILDLGLSFVVLSVDGVPYDDQPNQQRSHQQHQPNQATGRSAATGTASYLSAGYLQFEKYWRRRSRRRQQVSSVPIPLSSRGPSAKLRPRLSCSPQSSLRKPN